MKFATRILNLGVLPGDSPETRFKLNMYSLSTFTGMLLLFIWAIGDYLSGHLAAALLLFSQGLIFLIGYIYFLWRKSFTIPRILIFSTFLFNNALLTLMHGGFDTSAGMMLWGILIVLLAVTFESRREALFWLLLYLVLMAVIGAVSLSFPRTVFLSSLVNAVGFTTNMGILTILVFLVVRYYIGQRDEALDLFKAEQVKSENLLHNVLPEPIAERLKETQSLIVEKFDDVSILFADIVGFTPLSERIAPEESLMLLNEVFTHFDRLAEKYQVEKIRTIGDGYMAAAGVPAPQEKHAHKLANMALEMMDFMETVPNLEIRVGINSGPAVAGIVGTTKFHYDVWGDAVNVASRMESTGLPGKVQIGPGTHELIRDEFPCQTRGKILVKGKGEMETWFLREHPQK